MFTGQTHLLQLQLLRLLRLHLHRRRQPRRRPVAAYGSALHNRRVLTKLQTDILRLSGFRAPVSEHLGLHRTCDSWKHLGTFPGST